MAGGHDVLGRSGEPSRRATWDEIAAADPDVILLSPCGFSLERSEAELPALMARPEWRGLRAIREGRVALIDGSAYFSRPGPRLLDSLQIAAAAIDADRFRPAPARRMDVRSGSRLRPRAIRVRDRPDPGNRPHWPCVAAA